MVTFSKKMLTGGYFYRSEFRPDQAFRIFNTWLGDPSKLILLEAVIGVINKEQLIPKIAETGAYLLKSLEGFQASYPDILEAARGQGTFAAIDFKTSQLRDKATKELHLQGVHCGGSGDRSLRIRTTLTFNKNHVDIFAGKFKNVLETLK